MRPDDGVKPGGIDEGEVFEVEDDRRGLKRFYGREGLFQERSRRQVELTSGAQASDAISMLGSDEEGRAWLEVCHS